MPISASAKKSLRVAERRATENKAYKARLRNALRNRGSIEMSALFSLLDKAAKRNVIHKNKAARLKSRLAKAAAAPASTESAPVKPVKAATAKPAAKKAATKRTTKKTA
jgi:small subunit ribosomal protein S20